MKTIGMLGGMSWESTSEYYTIINKMVQKKLGGLHSAKIILHSFDFHEIEQLQHKGKWNEAGYLLADAAKNLENAGTGCIIICTNTMHKVAETVENLITIPLIHIADATADAIIAHKMKTVGLLGTKYTMEQDFYRGRLNKKFGLNTLIPKQKDRENINDIIYNELCSGVIKAESKNIFKKIIRELIKNGSEGIILGCTEIMLLVKQKDSEVPVFDTTAIHAEAAVEYSLKH